MQTLHLTERERRLPRWVQDELVANRQRVRTVEAELSRQNDGSLRAAAERALGALEDDAPMDLTQVVRMAATGILAALLAIQENQAELTGKLSEGGDLMNTLDTITEAIKDIELPDPADGDGDAVVEELRALRHSLDFPLKLSS